MIEHARNLMTVDAFYTWLADQKDAKYELVDGEPRLMAGANRRHDRIAVNALAHLYNALVGQPCQPFTADTFVRISNGNRRLPDVGIDCGTPDDESLEAADPIFVMEILSPTTRAFDRNDKLEEYKTIPNLAYILLVDPDYPQARLYHRGPDGTWKSTRYEGLDAVIEFWNLPVRLSLGSLYSSLTFQSRPMLVDPQGQSKFSI